MKFNITKDVPMRAYYLIIKNSKILKIGRKKSIHVSNTLLDN